MELDRFSAQGLGTVPSGVCPPNGKANKHLHAVLRRLVSRGEFLCYMMPALYLQGTLAQKDEFTLREI